MCEEYFSRKGIDFNFVRHVQKGFLFFDEDKKLLVIKWTKIGNQPGFYEISECLLSERIKTLKNSHVSWDEYEQYLDEWIRSHDLFVYNSNEIFDLVWSYFLRRNDKLFATNYDAEEIYETINKNNEQRVLNSFYFLEKITERHPDLANFWNSKASDIISKYSHWLLNYKNHIVERETAV